jgi:hypothetical protein
VTPYADLDRRREKKREYYQEHKDEMLLYPSRIPIARRDLQTRSNRWFSANLRILKAAQGCALCGSREEKDRLAHHHLDPSTKRMNVSAMGRYSIDSVIDEIAKCVVLCNSCHGKQRKGRHEV